MHGDQALWGNYYQRTTKVNRGYMEEAANDVIHCDLRYQGQLEDTESGLYYNLNRYYDADSGQYLSPDPIGMAGGMRPQGYVDNPVGFVDPLGLSTEGCLRFSDNFDKKLKKHAQDIYETSRNLGVPVAKGDKEGMKNFILSIVKDDANLANPSFKWNTIDSTRAYVKGDAVVLVNNKTNEILTFLHKERISSYLQEIIK